MKDNIGRPWLVCPLLNDEGDTDDREIWDDAIEDAGPKILAMIEATKALSKRLDVVCDGVDHVQDAELITEMRNAFLAVVDAAETLSKRLDDVRDGEMDAWLKEILVDLNEVLQDALKQMKTIGIP